MPTVLCVSIWKLSGVIITDMNRARNQGNRRLKVQPPHRLSPWIQRLWAGVIAVGCGITPAFAQAPDTPSIPTNPTLPNRSVQRVSRPTLRLESQGDAVLELQAMLTLLGYYTDSVDGVYQESTQAAVAQFQQAAGLVADGVVGPATWSLLLPLTPAQANPPQTIHTVTEAPTNTTNTPATVTEAPAAAAETAEPSISSPNQEALPDLSSPIPEPAAESPPSTTSDVSQTTDSSPVNDTGITSPEELPTLRLGMQGDAIVELQERLQALGFYNGAVDGVFGPETESAVMEAQRSYNLQSDGVVGPATWQALLQ